MINMYNIELVINVSLKGDRLFGLPDDYALSEFRSAFRNRSKKITVNLEGPDVADGHDTYTCQTITHAALIHVLTVDRKSVIIKG